MPQSVLFKQAFIWGLGAQLGAMCMQTASKVMLPLVKKATEELEKKRNATKA